MEAENMKLPTLTDVAQMPEFWTEWAVNKSLRHDCFNAVVS